MESNQALAALAALAQATRLAIFRLLVEAGPSGLAAGAIGAKLDVPAPTLSFHLRELSHAGLVSGEARGTFVVYRADFGIMNALLAYLTENCCRGGDCGDASVACVPAASPVRRASRPSRATKSARRS